VKKQRARFFFPRFPLITPSGYDDMHATDAPERALTHLRDACALLSVDGSSIQIGNEELDDLLEVELDGFDNCCLLTLYLSMMFQA
jgi:hypothetical protein